MYFDCARESVLGGNAEYFVSDLVVELAFFWRNAIFVEKNYHVC